MADVQNSDDPITVLSKAATVCFENAENGKFSSSEQDEFRKRGNELFSIADSAEDAAWDRNTSAFLTLTKDLADANATLQAELAKVNNQSNFSDSVKNVFGAFDSIIAFGKSLMLLKT